MDIPSALQEAQNWLRSAKKEEIDTVVQEVIRNMMDKDADRFRSDLSLNSGNDNAGRPPFKHPYYWAPYVCFGL